jgi:hypothetical protein
MGTLFVYPTKAQEKAVTAFLKALNVQFEKNRKYYPRLFWPELKKARKILKPAVLLLMMNLSNSFQVNMYNDLLKKKHIQYHP